MFHRGLSHFSIVLMHNCITKMMGVLSFGADVCMLYPGKIPQLSDFNCDLSKAIEVDLELSE